MFFSLHRGTAGKGLPHEAFVRLAARSGFPAADPDFTFADTHSLAAMRELYAANSLRLGGWGIPFDFRAPALDLDGVARLKRFAAFAAALGVDSCGNHIMPSSARPFLENWHFLTARLKPLAAILADHGLRLGLEPVAPRHLRQKFQHPFIFTCDKMLELAADIGPNVGLLVDSYHLHAAGEPMSSIAAIPRDKIVHVHINDAPAIAIEEINDFERVLPGQGVIDLQGFLAALGQTGYAGPISLEVFSPVLNALPPEESAALAWRSLQHLGTIADGTVLPAP
jgi:sugar phosphate isomerase/epimerase